jgi:hypothetical protein
LDVRENRKQNAELMVLYVERVADERPVKEVKAM